METAKEQDGEEKSPRKPANEVRERLERPPRDKREITIAPSTASGPDISVESH
jgi:hypothetical protein